MARTDGGEVGGPGRGAPDGEAAGAETRDLGFGAVVSQETRQRLLNRDGSFNVIREGLGYFRSLSLFHTLLTISWWKFFTVVAGAYLLANLAFSAAYLLCGTAALGGAPDAPPTGFQRAFFFSVQTSATIGYGNIHPVGLATNLIVLVEAISSILALAIATGIAFARFSRPTAKIVFSRRAVIAPYAGATALEFRIVNSRRTEIIELGAKVLFSRIEDDGGRRLRRFDDLVLERAKVIFFPLSWTVVHPIDARSPLRGWTARDLAASDAEFLVLLTGIDETFSQTVHARPSYKPDEIVWNARFADIFHRPTERGPLKIDAARLDEIVPLSAEPAGDGPRTRSAAPRS